MADVSGMTVVVTGARGRVGALLVDALLDAGAIVREIDALDPAPTEPSPRRSYQQVALGADGANPPHGLIDALRGADGVVHLAALMSWDDRRTDDLFRINTLGTLALLRGQEAAATDGRYPRLVMASTGEVYPEVAPAYLPIDEAHPTRPTSPYGLSKLMAENAAHYFARRRGAPVVIVRFSHIQRAVELADPDSFFSGPRFFVGSRLRRLRETAAGSAVPDPSVLESIARLESVDSPGRLQLLLPRGPQGEPYRMGIADARDIAHGLLLALTQPAAPGEVFNLGPADAFSFEDAIPYMARRWDLPYVAVELALPAYNYVTSVDKARRVLAYGPRFTFFDMIDAAAPDVRLRPLEGAVSA